jgi:hypothetical protein
MLHMKASGSCEIQVTSSLGPWDVKRRTLVGFIRQQEERLAVRLLIWQYQRMNVSVPALEELEKQAARFVEEAHRIARERGRNVISILKQMITDIKKGG